MVKTIGIGKQDFASVIEDNCFFSNQYKDRSDLFDSLSIWEYEDYRKIQGTYPVI